MFRSASTSRAYLTAFMVFNSLQVFFPAVAANLSSCYCFPGDACWPNTNLWSSFNSTVGGRLIATTPISSVCHGATYRQDECERLRDNWFFPETHLPSSSSVMAPLFANNSCSPFMPQNTSCALGNYVSYAVRIRDASDASKTLAFAAKHNVRLVIRNTGHDCTYYSIY